MTIKGKQIKNFACFRCFTEKQRLVSISEEFSTISQIVLRIYQSAIKGHESQYEPKNVSSKNYLVYAIHIICMAVYANNCLISYKCIC